MAYTQADRDRDKILMADALANLVLYFPLEVDDLLAKYGVNSKEVSPSTRLEFVESKIQSNKKFAQEVVNMIGTLGGNPPSQFTNFVDAILAAVGGVSNAINGIVDATNPASQEAKKTNAQAALINAQANLESARSKATVEESKQKTLLIVGVSLAVATLIGVGVIAYFKFRRNK